MPTDNVAARLRGLVEAASAARRATHDGKENARKMAEVRATERDVVDLLLADPCILALVEAGQALGVAKAVQHATRNPWRDGKEAYKARVAADVDVMRATEALLAAADALHGKGENE